MDGARLHRTLHEPAEPKYAQNASSPNVGKSTGRRGNARVRAPSGERPVLPSMPACSDSLNLRCTTSDAGERGRYLCFLGKSRIKADEDTTVVSIMNRRAVDKHVRCGADLVSPYRHPSISRDGRGEGGKSRVDFGGSADDPREARGNVCAYGMVVFRGKAAKY